MKNITPQECADFLESAHIENSFDIGSAIIHSGVSASGLQFILRNDCFGQTVLGEFA